MKPVFCTNCHDKIMPAQEAEDRAHQHQVAIRLLALNSLGYYLKSQDGRI